jgi:hypothetical protein
MVQVGSQTIIEGSFSKTLSYLPCSQIWLNLPIDNRHFGYMTKLTQKITFGGV